MGDILTSYSREGVGLDLCIGSLYGIPTLCKKCGKYLLRECAPGSPGLYRCRRGYSLCFDKETMRVYFGFLLEGKCDTRRFRLASSYSDVISRTYFENCLKYSHSLFELKKVRDNLASPGCRFDSCVANVNDRLKKIRHMGDDENVRVPVEDIGAITRNIANLRAYRQEISACAKIKFLDELLLPTHVQGETREAVDSFRKQALLFGRFVHDIGQYLPGFNPILPPRLPDKGDVELKLSQIKTMEALTLALMALKRFYVNACNNVWEERQSEPYQMFDKYRYCFRGIDYKIKLKSVREELFFETILAIDGFELVALNLLSNAVKYLPPSHGKRQVITVEFEKGDLNIWIRVISQGPLLMESECEMLGRRCMRGANAERSGTAGDGMGLVIVQDIVEKSCLFVKFSSYGKVTEYGDVPWRTFCAEITVPNDRWVH